MSVQVKRRRESAAFLAGFVGAQGDPTVGLAPPGGNASSVLTNPYHHTSKPKPNHGR